MQTKYLLAAEVDRVLAALTPSNRLVLRVMLHTGLRVTDVLRLKPEQLKRRVWITECKTGKRRLIGFPADLLHDLKDHAGKHWVFPARNGTSHRTRQAVWSDVKRAAKAFRIPQNVGTHSARKVFAVELMRKYGDIEQVRKVLNHDRWQTTIIYACADQLMHQKYKRRSKKEAKY